MLMNDNNVNTVNIVNKQDERRERNKQKIANKLLDYDLFLDKKQLKANKKLKVIEKDNEFKTREVKAKCSTNTLVLKGGYVLGRFCLLLTFVSCLLTFGGNIESFICNIPLIDNEIPSDFLFTWKTVNSILNNNGAEVRNVTIYRLNMVTAPIYTLFLVGMQCILYQVSITIHIIKLKFKAYYIYALIVQYSMLFYSVYSNYKFLSHYVRPANLTDSFMVFIPSLLLDISCIFFLSLSMRMKTLNFDNDIEDNMLIKLIKNSAKYKAKNSAKYKAKNKAKNSTKYKAKYKAKNSTKYKAKNSTKLNNVIERKKRKNSTKNSTKLKKNENAESIGNTCNGNKKAVLKKDVNKSSFEGKKSTGNSTNKAKDKELKAVLNYIEKLKENNTKIIKVKDLKNSTKIDKNKWLKIKDILLEKNIIHVNAESPRTINISYGG